MNESSTISVERVKETKKQRHKWLPYLTLLLLLELCVTAYLLRDNPIVLRNFDTFLSARARARYLQTLQALMKADPLTGQPAPAFEKIKQKMHQAGLSVKKPLVLVLMGPCSSCVTQEFSSWQRVQEQHPTLQYCNSKP